ncbi:L-xylulose reductase-like [Anoplophora glabripennis]|uniref:L-xylulose reductase-like n=1 Tax=Anoplophora glabripennis TaxID=217634 RepID=UPI0008737B44|nr:L-xylulose reductase-like [Anoplophora glabripennis]
MDIKFDGKRALVTGAASGIGRGIALQLAKGGARVIALDVSEDQLIKLKEEIPSLETVAVDLSDWKATQETVKSVCPIDLLVNNAGLGEILALTQVTEENYNKIFNVNVKALINVTKVVVEDLLNRESPGAIVNISSQASQAALPNHTLYCASKAAVDGFTRAVAMDYGPKKIRINAVNPTVVMTELGRRFWSDPALSQPMLAKIPLGRFGEISDVVAAVLFLLSDHASLITGICFPVDGGFLAC